MKLNGLLFALVTTGFGTLLLTWLNTERCVANIDAPHPFVNTDLPRNNSKRWQHSNRGTCGISVLKHYTQKKNQTRCQWANFMNFMSNRSYFPGRGHWEMSAPGRAFSLMFFPDLCNMDDFVPSNLQRCVQKKKWKKIVTIGDSIGKRYYLTLSALFESISLNCTLKRLEANENSFMPDMRYFIHGRSIPKDIFITKSRSCHSCGGRYTNCSLSKGQSLVIEHLALTHLNDTTMRTEKKFEGRETAIPIVRNTMELYLKWYLQEDPPDVIIIEPPFAHTVADDLSVSVDNLQRLINTTEALLPKTVTVIWMTQTKIWKFEEMHGDQKNVKLNHALFQLLKSRFIDPTDKWHGFYDLHSVSCPLKFLTDDGVHLDRIYYKTMMKHLLELLCFDTR